MLGHLQQRLTHLGIARKLLRPVDQPQVEPVFHGAQIAGQLGVIALGIVHQVTRMHLEEARQQHARRIGQVRARPALDLRHVRLAEPAAHFLLQCNHQVLLGHLAAHAAQSAFDQPEVTDFFAQLHITICNYNIAISNVKNWICPGIREFGGKRAGDTTTETAFAVYLRRMLPRVRSEGKNVFTTENTEGTEKKQELNSVISVSSVVKRKILFFSRFLADAGVCSKTRPTHALPSIREPRSDSRVRAETLEDIVMSDANPLLAPMKGTQHREVGTVPVSYTHLRAHETDSY